MKIDRQRLYKLYMKQVEEISEECDWKTHFTAEECVHLVADVLEKHPDLVSKCTYQLAYMVDTDTKYDGCEFFILGILDENGEFQDFYYSSGIEYEHFQQWIPDEFSEAAESCYEFSHRRHPSKNAKDILKAAGYIEIEERLD